MNRFNFGNFVGTTDGLDMLVNDVFGVDHGCQSRRGYEGEAMEYS